MSSLDASALTQDPDGLGVLRDVLGSAGARPSLAAAFGVETDAMPETAEWVWAGAAPDRMLADLLN